MYVVCVFVRFVFVCREVSSPVYAEKRVDLGISLPHTRFSPPTLPSHELVRQPFSLFSFLVCARAFGVHVCVHACVWCWC